MIFEYILAQLDGELAHWQQLRAIVAGLHTPAFVAAALPELALAPPRLNPPTPPRHKPTRQRATRSSVRHLSKTRFAEPRALTNVIPAGPVVVFAAALREQATNPKQLPGAAAEIPVVDPETLLRELSQRWGTAAATHPA